MHAPQCISVLTTIVVNNPGHGSFPGGLEAEGVLNASTARQQHDQDLEIHHPISQARGIKPTVTVSPPPTSVFSLVSLPRRDVPTLLWIVRIELEVRIKLFAWRKHAQVCPFIAL